MKKAIELGKENATLVRSVKGKESIEYAIVLHQLSTSYAALDYLKDAIKVGSIASDIYKKNLPIYQNQYAHILSELGYYYDRLGDNDNALKHVEEAFVYFQKDSVNDPISYAMALNDMAAVYYNRQNLDKAIDLAQKAMNIISPFKNRGLEYEYSIVLKNLAWYLYMKGNLSMAYNLYSEQISVTKNFTGYQRLDYINALNNLSLVCNSLNRNDIALKYGLEALNMCKRYLGTRHDNYIASLNNVSKIYMDRGNYKKAIYFATESANINQQKILNYFLDMIGLERDNIWDQKGFMYNIWLPSYLYKSHDTSFAEVVYNKTALFAKGLLLSAETEMSRLIQESGDKTALEKYELLRENRNTMNKIIETPISKRNINTDSLQKVIENQEHELVQKSKVYGDYTHNMRLTWKDVQAELPDNAAAVEFLSFPLNADSTMYIALTVRKGYKLPKMTVLFEERQLDRLSSDIDGQTAFMPSESLTNLVWKPLEKELKGVKNIYFSPSGKLHNIGIEYLPGVESYNLYRLSSTRDLAINKDKTTSTNTATLYGGIKYDTDIATMTAESKNYHTNKSETSAQQYDLAHNTQSLSRSLHLRSEVSYLPSSKLEVKAAEKALKQSGVSCTLLTDSKATEESFKALSGKRTKILHISTHGFYYTPEEAERNKDLKFIQQPSSRINYEEDKSLTHSGLVFAGANNVLEGVEIPEGVDDGILTAKEISQIDLRGMDLVVLSACQTGLGDVTQGEGVFGLQRAFKKAGANTILMSLWKVDDKATQILMTSFYEHLN